MRRLYTVLLYLMLPFVLVRLWWRGKKTPAYRQRWKQRFGFFSNHNNTAGIWVHAVSLGETITATPLIKKLQQLYPQLSITVTNMTPTGSTQAQKSFGNAILNLYVPYDYPFAIKNFLKRIKPKILIIMETELWPNLIYYSHKQKIPIVLANARLSEKSFKGYYKYRWLTQPMLSNITQINAQHESDKQRFIKLGYNDKQISTTGSLKFDITINSSIIDQGKSLRQNIGADRQAWIAASTHYGEDELILQAHRTVLQNFPHALLILVPRHPERFNNVFELCQQYGLNTVRRSSNEKINETTQVYLGDTMGELLTLYATIDIAFVGGSLVNHGGHNILEPAAIGLPIISGPHTNNFKVISELFYKADALAIVSDEKELANEIINLFSNKETGNNKGNIAKTIIEQNKGSLLNHINSIQTVLNANS